MPDRFSSPVKPPFGWLLSVGTTVSVDHVGPLGTLLCYQGPRRLPCRIHLWELEPPRAVGCPDSYSLCRIVPTPGDCARDVLSHLRVTEGSKADSKGAVKNEALLLPGAGCLWLFSAACGCWAQMPGGLSHCAGAPTAHTCPPSTCARGVCRECVCVPRTCGNSGRVTRGLGLGQGAHFRGGKHLP